MDIKVVEGLSSELGNMLGKWRPQKCDEANANCTLLRDSAEHFIDHARKYQNDYQKSRERLLAATTFHVTPAETAKTRQR